MKTIGAVALVLLASAACREPHAAPEAVLVQEELAYPMLVGTQSLNVVAVVPVAMVSSLALDDAVAIEVRRGTPRATIERVVPFGRQTPGALWIPAKFTGFFDPESQLTTGSRWAILRPDEGRLDRSLLREEESKYDPRTTPLIDAVYRPETDGRLGLVTIRAAGRMDRPPVTWK